MKNFKKLYTEKFWERKERREKSFLRLYNLFYKKLDFNSFKKDISFARAVIRQASKKGIIGIFIFAVLFILEKLLYSINNSFLDSFKNIIILDYSIFRNLLFALLSIAGIFLGLFYTNISSVYSANYANAPEVIRNLFLNEDSLDKYVSLLIYFITNIIMIILTNIFGFGTGFLFVILTIITSFYLVTVFPIIGKTAYRMANYNTIMSPLYSDVIDIYGKVTAKNNYFKNVNLQYNYQKLCRSKLEIIATLLKFYTEHKEIKSDIISEILGHNLMLISKYSKLKSGIPRSSYWFPYVNKTQKWIYTSDHEISVALNTGTFISLKKEKNYNWFENALLEENNVMLKFFFENGQLQSVINYCNIYASLDNELFSDYNYEYETLSSLNRFINNRLIPEKVDTNNIEEWSVLCDTLNLINIGYILKISKLANNFEIEELVSFIKKCSFDEKEIYSSPFPHLNNDRIILLFNSIHNEIIIEGKKITPDWFIIQYILKELVKTLNQAVTRCIDLYKEIIIVNTDSLHKKELYYQAVFGHIREIEIYKKIGNLLNHVQELYDKLSKYNIEKSYEINMLDLKKIDSEIKKIHLSRPSKWYECCYYLEKNKLDIEQPDFIGFVYYNYCELMMCAIYSLDEDFFLTNLQQFWKLIMLTDKDITETMLKEKQGILSVDDHNFWAKATVMSQAIFDFMTIVGYALILGEFITNTNFSVKIREIIENILKKLYEVDSNALKRFIAFGDIRKNRGIAIYDRDLIYTSWEQTFCNSLEANELLKFKYVGQFHQKVIDTESILLHAIGFMSSLNHFSADAHEVFLIECVNKHFSVDEKNEGRGNWERRLGKDE